MGREEEEEGEGISVPSRAKSGEEKIVDFFLYVKKLPMPHLSFFRNSVTIDIGV